MRKQKRRMFFGVGMLAALILFTALVRLPEEKKQDEQLAAEEVQKQENLIKCMEEIQSIQVEKNGERTELFRKDGKFIVQGIPEEKRDDGKSDAAVIRLYESRVTEHLGEQEELGQFGLGEEAAQIIIMTGSDQIQKFKVGNWLKGSGNEIYVLLDGDVCTVKYFPPELIQGKKAFYSLDLISIMGRAEDGEAQEPQLNYLELTGENFEEPIIIIRSGVTESGFLMKEPVYSEAMFAPTDMQTGSISMLSCLQEVSAEAVAVLHADAETVRQYGMDKPQACVRYSFDGEEHSLMVGERRDDGTRYLMVDDDQNIYLIGDERVSAWAEADVMDLRTSYIWLVDVSMLEKLIISDRKKEFEYRLEWKQGEEGRKELAVNYGGKIIDAEKIWLPFYQKLLGMTVMSVVKPSAWEKKPDCSVTFCYAEEYQKDAITVSFYKSLEDDCYAALLNGNFAGTLRINTVEEIMELTDRVNAYEDNK